MRPALHRAGVPQRCPWVLKRARRGRGFSPGAGPGRRQMPSTAPAEPGPGWALGRRREQAWARGARASRELHPALSALPRGSRGADGCGRICAQGTSGTGGAGGKTAWAALNLTCGAAGQPRCRCRGAARHGGGRGQSLNMPGEWGWRGLGRRDPFIFLEAAKAGRRGPGGRAPPPLLAASLLLCPAGSGGLARGHGHVSPSGATHGALFHPRGGRQGRGQDG